MRKTGLFVIFVSLLVMAGWIFEIEILKRIYHQWVSMKFLTAICFLFSGFILIYFKRCMSHKNVLAEFIVSVSTFGIASIMGMLMIETLYGVNLGVSHLFVTEKNTIKTIDNGIPSLGTTINFMCISAIGLLSMFNTDNFYRRSLYFSVFILLTSVVAITGYVVNNHYLYYYIPGKSTGMALHTALLFMVIGGSLYRYGQIQRRINSRVGNKHNGSDRLDTEKI